MLINVVLLDDDILQLEVEPHNTMKQLKYLIGASQGYPPEDIVFMHMGEVTDNATIESQGIRQNSYVKFGVISHSDNEDM